MMNFVCQRQWNRTPALSRPVRIAPDGYLVTDAQGWSKANRAQRLLKVKQKFLVGRWRLHLDRQTFVLTWTSCSKWTGLVHWKWACNREGVNFDAALTVTAIRNSQGKLLALRWLLRDITDRKRALALQQLNADLERQVQERTSQLQQALDFEAMLKRITDKVRDSLDERQILQTAVQEFYASER